MNSCVRRAILWGSASILATGLAQGADGPALKKEEKPATPRAVCPAVDPPFGISRIAFIDPQTGQLRAPTPEEAARLAEAARAARLQVLSALKVVEHPDGRRSIDLGDAFLFDLFAVRGRDGSITKMCIPPGTAAIPATPRPAPVLEEK